MYWSDYKWRIRQRAEEIAFQETGRDYCDLLPGEQEFFYGIADREQYEG